VAVHGDRASREDLIATSDDTIGCAVAEDVIRPASGWVGSRRTARSRSRGRREIGSSRCRHTLPRRKSLSPGHAS
jgi:hypothetical protein